MPKVYIVQDLGSIDFAGTAEFGEKVTLVDKHVSNRTLERVFQDMRKKMKGITDQDWIVPAGHPALIAYAGAIMQQEAGCIRVLAWDRQKKEYLKSEVEL